jgi:RimJ/RimL family protein N-acetyltransferase/nucleotide-binding universal stress UspA family protein
VSTRLDLRDGSSVCVRPIETGDREALARAFERLSPQSRYRRFFSPVSQLSERQLDYLTDIDHHDHEALVALPEEGGDPVAVARYVRVEGDVAEPAIVVADDWQGRGVASRLLDVLADRAREERITSFVAPVLSENRAAIRLFEGLGDTTLRHDGREVELTIPLGPGRGATPSLRRVLGQVAAGSVRPALAFWQRIVTSASPPERRRNAVVVGVPRAESLERVAEVAAATARATGAEVHIVAARRFLLDDRDDLHERMRAVERRMARDDLRVESHACRGDLAASLIHEAVERGAGVIVVDGSEPHAATPLLGSTWDHVSHHAPCDVLIAR